MVKKIACLALVAGALSATPAAAQVPWESPLLVGPGSPGGLSVLLVDPGAGLGVMAHWMGSSRNARLGWRLGLAEEGGPDDDLAVFGGVDVSGPLVDHSAEFPLDVDWVTGVGAGFGDNVLITIPLGVTMGRVLDAEDVSFHPYLTPRVLVDALAGDSANDDMELGFALDLGVDVFFSQRWALRFGASVGDREGVAVGFAVPMG